MPAMTETDILAGLTEVFRDVFMDDDMQLRPGLSAADVPAWDSFKQIEIIMATEERFGIKLMTREIDGLRNVGDLVAVIAAKFDAAKGAA